MRLLPWLVLSIALAPTLARAQAPVISPAGDPSVESDSIYRLAVKPEDYPDEPFIYLLDDGVARFETDGTGRRTYRQVVQILKQDAVEDWAEQQFGYAPGHQRLTVNWIRVVRPDGTVISDKPTISQDADIPATISNPVYSDRKLRRVSLSGVAPGTIVDYSYTIEELKPFRDGDFYATWGITTGHFTRRSRYLVDLPAAMQPHLTEHNLTFPRRTTVAGARRTYLWAANDVPKVKSELYAADSNGVYMSVELAAPTTWDSIGRWYAGLARDRYTVSPALEARLHELVRDARTGADSLRAVHRWVAQDVRYVSVALGIGGYQPRAPGEVLETGFGDCKDKATVFIALAARLGLTAFPVLLSAGGTVDHALPSIEQFDHAIAAVRRPGGGYTFVDLTSELTPYGELPPSDQGEFALVIHPDGATEQVTLPETGPEANVIETRIVGELAPTGLLNGRIYEQATGSRQYTLRNLFASPLDSTRRAEMTRAIASALFTGAVGDSLVSFDGRDLGADAAMSLVIRDGQAARPAGNTAILNVPFPSMSGLVAAAAELESRGPRRFPINVASVVGPLTSIKDFRITLPDGWQAQLPEDVTVDGAYGRYTATFRQQGRELHIVRRIEGRRGIEPPARVEDLIAWLRAAARDDAQYVVLERPRRTP